MPLLGEPMAEVVMTAGERLIERGRVEGRVEGRLEGRVEGRLEGRVEALIELIELKFDVDSEAVRRRVRAASPDELRRWGAAILRAETLDAVFA